MGDTADGSTAIAPILPTPIPSHVFQFLPFFSLYSPLVILPPPILSHIFSCPPIFCLLHILLWTHILDNHCSNLPSSDLFPYPPTYFHIISYPAMSSQILPCHFIVASNSSHISYHLLLKLSRKWDKSFKPIGAKCFSKLFLPVGSRQVSNCQLPITNNQLVPNAFQG